MLVTVRESDAASPWDVLTKNTLHEQKLRDWKHASAEERAFDKLASVMQKVSRGSSGVKCTVDTGGQGGLSAKSGVRVDPPCACSCSGG